MFTHGPIFFLPLDAGRCICGVQRYREGQVPQAVSAQETCMSVCIPPAGHSLTAYTYPIQALQGSPQVLQAQDQ